MKKTDEHLVNMIIQENLQKVVRRIDPHVYKSVHHKPCFWWTHLMRCTHSQASSKVWLIYTSPLNSCIRFSAEGRLLGVFSKQGFTIFLTFASSFSTPAGVTFVPINFTIRAIWFISGGHTDSLVKSSRKVHASDQTSNAEVARIPSPSLSNASGGIYLIVPRAVVRCEDWDIEQRVLMCASPRSHR